MDRDTDSAAIYKVQVITERREQRYIQNFHSEM